MLRRVLVLKRGQLVQIVDMYSIEHQPGERGGKWRKRRREKWGVRKRERRRVSEGGGEREEERGA